MGVLKFTRKLEQGLWIGAAHVKLVKTERNRAHLVVTAPPRIRVDRDENVPQQPEGSEVKHDD